MAEKSAAGAASAGLAAGEIICVGESANGAAGAGAVARGAGAGGTTGFAAGGIAGATAAGLMGAGAGATLASSSAMICLMDDRISSMDGSLVAGLFI
jgi:hypothetical protein